MTSVSCAKEGAAQLQQHAAPPDVAPEALIEQPRAQESAALQQQLQQLQISSASTQQAPAHGNGACLHQPGPLLHAAAAVAPAPAIAAAGAVPGCGDDVVTLNVGGRLFSCQRRTLCLVEESVLALMFGGRWPGGGATDAAGNVFLDLDPALFEVVLNWLRQFALSRGGNMHEPQVPSDKLEHMVAMLDYLQLHRHIPLTYREAFDASHASPFMAINGAAATRGFVAASHPGKHTTRPGNTLMQFAVSDHSYFDMALVLQLEVATFKDSREGRTPPRWMFIGFMHRAVAATLDPAGDINTQCTKSPGCYGWLVSGQAAYTVRHGQRSHHACHTRSAMFSQGDQLLLSLDTRRDLPYATISLLNTRTNLWKSIDADSTPGSSSSGGKHSTNVTASSSSSSSSASNQRADAANGQQQQQQQQQQARRQGKRRPGLRHRRAATASLQFPHGPQRDEVLALLALQPAGMVANAQAAELVVGAALQLLEAQGLGMQQAFDILRRPGLVARLVQQVQAEVRVQPGVLLPELQRDVAAGAALNRAVGAAAVGAGGDAAGGQQQQGVQPAPEAGAEETAAAAAPTEVEAGAAGAGSVEQQRLPDGSLLPACSAEYEWVLVVGMVQPGDSVKILSVRRKGQRPGSAE